jgi:uncharacterized protein (TIGR00297 family)
MASLLEAVLVNLTLAGVAIGARMVRPSAAWGGLAVGILIYLGAGRAGFGLLVLFFAVGVALTRVGFARKAAKGLAEANEGRRGSAHALANAGTAALCSAAMLIWPEARVPLAVAFAGGLAAALADTSGSEIGQLLGHHPISPVTFRPVPPGTEGAVSAEGTLAAVASAAFIGLAGAALAFYPWTGGLAAAIGGVVGSVLESVVGSFSWSRRLGHMALNFSNTVVGALAAVIAFVAMGR